jgi:hypothetical protein
MSYNYTLRYRTFDQLLSDIQVDFKNIQLQNYIDPQQLIKVAKRVNYDLGLRIFKTKEAILDVEKNRVRLPDDFFVLNFALICDELVIHEPVNQGTWIEERPVVTPYQQTSTTIDTCVASTVNCQVCNNTPCGCQNTASCQTCNTCNTSPCGCSNQVINVPPHSAVNPYGSYCQTPKVFTNCKGDAYELVQIVNSTQRVYKRQFPIRILENPQSIDCDCPNLYWNAGATAWIRDGWLYTSFDCGTIYINYQGMLDDEHGNLLVPDHDMINEYYEYAVKQRILENLMMNDDATAANKLQVVEQRLRAARNNALSIVNTPNFSEMKRVWEMNRKAQYSKYYDMFKSYPWNQGTVNNQQYPNSYTRN